jgi:phage shock protein C
MTDEDRPEEAAEPDSTGESAAAESSVAEDVTAGAEPQGRPEHRVGAAGPRPRLYRSEENRILGGVAAGMGDYFDLDPVIVRLLWVLATAMGGAGALAYLVLWIVIPPYSRLHGDAPAGHERTGDSPAAGPAMPFRPDLVFGGILVLLGALLLMGSFDLGPGWDIFARLWPLALLLPGALLVMPRAGRWPSTGVLLAGGLLLAVGLINLLGSLDIWWGYSAWGRLWPLLLVAIGAAIVLPRVDSRD